MILYLIRHGVAVEGEKAGVSDGERPLTSAGIQRMRQNARGLHRLDTPIEAIWTSPLVRARQTADLIAREFALTDSVTEEPALLPGADPARLVERLRQAPKDIHLALVGHDPNISKLATFLLTGLKTQAIQFKKGGAACIEIDGLRRAVRGELVWMLTPRQMRRIRKED